MERITCMLNRMEATTMSKPPQDSDGLYHIMIPLGAFGDPQFDEESAIIRPVSKAEAEALTKLFHEVTRNQACPCGSGNKFKKCCQRKGH